MVKKSVLVLALIAGTALTANAQQEESVQDSIVKSLTLQEVSVVAQKPIIKMDTDKVTYDVTLDSDAKASTVLDMLRKVPMVTVDGQDNITVNGSSAFKVYVDGKPNVMFSGNPSQIFKAMPAVMVKNIEVVTNPGAKYDAEGAGGILNITLNRSGMPGASGAGPSLNGINGNVRLQGGNKSYGASAFINGQQDKFSFSANGTLNKQMMNGTEVEMIQEQLGANPSKSINLQHDGKTRVPFGMANISLGYDIDEMSNVNASLGLTMFKTKNSGAVTNSVTGGIYGQGFSYDMHNVLDNKRSGMNASIDYQRFLNKDRSSSITMTYLFSHNPARNQNTSEFDRSAGLPEQFGSFLIDRYSDSNDRSNEHTLQIDYTTPLATNHNLNLGTKLTSHTSESDAEFYMIGNDGEMKYQEELSSDYRNGKSILAGYAEYEGKFGKFSSRAGMRYEHTWQSVEYLKGNSDNYDSNYGNVIPSLSFSYSPIPVANIGLTYNMRISRPGISYLNPYIDRSSNTALTYGNPDLDVEKSHTVGMVANMFTPKIMVNFNLRYALTDNAISQYSFYDNNHLLNTTYGNIVKKQATSLSLFANYLLHKNTRIFTNAGLSYNDLNSEQLKESNSGWQYNLMLGLQQTLPLSIKLGAYLISNSKTYTLQGWSSGFNIITGNVSKSFLNDKLTLSLQAMTGLNKGGCINIETYSSSSTFVNSSNIRVPMSNVSLSVTYNFGNSKVKTRSHKSKVQSDVIERSNNMEQLNQMNQN